MECPGRSVISDRPGAVCLGLAAGRPARWTQLVRRLGARGQGVSRIGCTATGDATEAGGPTATHCPNQW